MCERFYRREKRPREIRSRRNGHRRRVKTRGDRKHGSWRSLGSRRFGDERQFGFDGGAGKVVFHESENEVGFGPRAGQVAILTVFDKCVDETSAVFLIGDGSSVRRRVFRRWLFSRIDETRFGRTWICCQWRRFCVRCVGLRVHTGGDWSGFEGSVVLGRYSSNRSSVIWFLRLRRQQLGKGVRNAMIWEMIRFRWQHNGLTEWLNAECMDCVILKLHHDEPSQLSTHESIQSRIIK